MSTQWNVNKLNRPRGVCLRLMRDFTDHDFQQATAIRLSTEEARRLAAALLSGADESEYGTVHEIADPSLNRGG